MNSFYKQLFVEGDDQHEWIDTPYTFPVMDSSEVGRLNVMLTLEEVKIPLLYMKPWKSPGPSATGELLPKLLGQDWEGFV